MAFQGRWNKAILWSFGSYRNIHFLLCGPIDHLSESGFAEHRQRRPMRLDRSRAARSSGSGLAWVKHSVKQPLRIGSPAA